MCKDVGAGTALKRKRSDMITFLQEASLQWDLVKAGTLRSIGKDLGAGMTTKWKRSDMISFLQEVEKQGLDALVQGGKSATSDDTSAESLSVDKPVTELPATPAVVESPEVDRTDVDMDHVESAPTCKCDAGWLSPPLKVVLCDTAGFASDLIRDTGELAAEMGHVGGVYLAHHIPVNQLPRGRSAAPRWVEGFSTIFSVIAKMFEAGKVPNEDALEDELNQLPKDKLKHVKACLKYTELEFVLEALVHGAEQEWEDGGFKAEHCDRKWKSLPVCAEHDLNWTMALDMLAE